MSFFPYTLAPISDILVETIRLAAASSYTFRGTIAETIDALFDAPYHRTPFLDPSIKEIGVGKASDYTIIEFGMGNNETTV
ncbi:hypothetical protein FE783_09350 [Paenibacillus mesophilus]|uniref:hypothetical protein n=1 Tax=Paenibacillus mesophilus TaxID=2582849 RepID=UPI00110E85B7|nr:hypothetical protein [Paenibacillus mesophilus]TMV50863.1 hypothetical protein FE783_09350 [Paenibacillus mesophilus]